MTNEISSELLAGSWIVDAGPNQMKTITTYSPLGGGKYGASENLMNFDWTMGGTKPTATHGTQLVGIVEANEAGISFNLICYALDASEKPVYIVKAVGNKFLKDPDTISVENLVMYFYNNPEMANPVSDEPDFCLPESGTFPPVHEYRIKVTA